MGKIILSVLVNENLSIALGLALTFSNCFCGNSSCFFFGIIFYPIIFYITSLYRLTCWNMAYQTHLQYSLLIPRAPIWGLKRKTKIKSIKVKSIWLLQFLCIQSEWSFLAQKITCLNVINRENNYRAWKGKQRWSP